MISGEIGLNVGKWFLEKVVFKLDFQDLDWSGWWIQGQD